MVDIVVNSEDHTLLEQPSVRPVVDAFWPTGHLTVFAPDDAINALVEAFEITADDLLDLGDLGRHFLQYHVVAGAAMSSELRMAKP